MNQGAVSHSLMGAVVTAGFAYGGWLAAGSLPAQRKLLAVLQMRRSTGPEVVTLAFSVGSAGALALATGLLSRSPLLTVLAALGGGLLGRWLARQHRASEAALLELQTKLLIPRFLDGVSLSIAAGLAPRTAIAQAVRTAHPIVSTSWQAVAEDPQAQLPMSDLLQTVAAGTSQTNRRVAHQLLIAIERGSPLSSALQQLSRELASESKRELLELAAKQEVKMMLPVVFGILPSVTVIALYPALAALAALS